MSQTILVVGATGNYAQPVCRQLSQDGFAVRVLTRKREKAERIFGDRFPIFVGDVEDPASLTEAIEGCWGVHVSLRGWFKHQSHDSVEHKGTANVVRAAQAAGVRRLTYLSCLFARAGYSDLAHLKAKVDAEAAIRASGIPFAIFAPSFFMENMLHLKGGRRIFVPSLPERTFHYLAADDYTQRVARCFRLPEAPNRRFDLYGPEPLTQREATLRFCAQARPGTSVHFVPIWVSDLYQRLIGHKNRQYSMRILRLYQSNGEPPATAETRAGQDLLDRPATTYRSWCEAQPPGASIYHS
jgi:uncharacterized protein YbjT (DUF2867 family)